MMVTRSWTVFGCLLLLAVLMQAVPVTASTDKSKEKAESNPGMITLGAVIQNELGETLAEPVFSLYVGQRVELTVVSADGGMDQRLEIAAKVMEGDGDFYHVVFEIRDTTPGAEWAFEASNYVRAGMPAVFELESNKPGMDRTIVLNLLDSPIPSTDSAQISDESF